MNASRDKTHQPLRRLIDMPSPAKKHPDPAIAGSSRSRKAMPKKPKFLSLRRIELSTTLADAMASHRCYQRRKRRARQPNTSPLQPDIANDEDAKDAQNVYEDNVNVTLLFKEDDESATTLSGILDGGDTAAVACSEEPSVGSRDSARGMADSVDYGGGNHHHRSSLLVRAAMKSVGRDKEEKWVSYDEVVERKPPPSDYEPEEVSSCSAVDNYCECSDGQDWWLWHPMGKGDRSGVPLLKLDYEDVLNSWSYEGPLFVGGDGGALLHLKHEAEAPQIVPELTSEYPGTDSGTNNVKSDTMEGSANLWTVPEQKGDGADSMSEDKFRLREASVLRYKEKRQNRLFSKRIRYEVRRLNAEKRPRVKGRFVRRNGEDD